MKIVLLTEYYKPEMGASQNRLYEMVMGLKEAGNEVCVVTGMPNYPTGKIFDGYKGKFKSKETIDGILVKRFWLYASNSKKSIPRILNMISFTVTAFCALPYLRKVKPDYLIVESVPLPITVTARILAKLCGAKLVGNVPDLWPLTAKEMGAMSGDSMLYKFLERVERRFYKKSYILLGQSQQIVDHIKTHGGKEVYLFRNGVDNRRFANLSRTRSDERFVITYAGILGYAQGLYELCQHVNFKELGAEFHIYGAGGEKEQIEQFLKENPDRGVFYHGSVSREEVPQVLVDSDATLVPLIKHIYGAVPSKIYESMAAGLPILFSGEGEGQNIVEKYQIGLVAAAKDYEKIKENISVLASNKELRETMRKNCVECANNVFNRPKQIVAMNAYLEEKLNR